MAPRLPSRICCRIIAMFVRNQSRSVLLAEDETAIADLLASGLREEGFQVTCAFSGDAALAHLASDECPFDVIVIDIGLPGTSGFTVLSHAGRLQPCPAIIVITGHADISVSDLPVRDAALLHKPFGLAQFVDHICRLADRRHTQVHHINERNDRMGKRTANVRRSERAIQAIASRRWKPKSPSNH